MSMRPDDTIRCSFCGRTQDQVWKMIAGADNNNVYICDECMELCSEILEEGLEGQDEGGSPTPADIRLLKPKEVRVLLDEYAIRQGDAKKVLFVAIYNHHKRVTACQNMDVDVQKSNILMMGPTGLDKTCLAQTLARTLNVPFTIADATVLTETEHMSEDVENILLRLIQVVDYDISRAEYDIIYIDKTDKATRKSENVSTIRDVSDEGVQQVLLKILEGVVANAPPQGGRKHPYQELLQVDTTNILSICSGAFDGLEKIVEQRLSVGSISFNAEVANRNDLNIDGLLKKVEPKGLTRFGLIPGFTGRVPAMVSLKQLAKGIMVRILSESKNAPMRQCQKLFELDNIKLGLTREVLEETAQLAVDHKIGARGLCSVLKSVMMDLMYKIPSDDFIGICTIARDVMEKAGQPELVYRDMPPASARKPSSERLRGDGRTRGITWAAMLLQQFGREKESLQIRYDPDQKARFPVGPAPASQWLFKWLRYKRRRLRMGEQVTTMPVVTLRSLTMLPGMVLHFDVNRPRSVAVIERAMVGDQKLSLMTQGHPEIVESEQGDLFQVGTVVVMKQLTKLPGKMVCILVKGLERTELSYLEAEEPAMMGEIATIEAEEDNLDSMTQEAVLRVLKGKLEEYGRANPKITKEILPSLMIIIDLNGMLDQIAIQLPWDYTVRQTVLEGSSLSVRYGVVVHALLTEMEIYKIKKEFQEKVKVDIDQSQKGYILREQMKVIYQELGENTMPDADEHQKRLNALKADKEVKEKLCKEIKHFRNMPAGSQEANALCTYVETLLGLPWKKMSKDDDDVKYVERILNGDHYGLEQVKERVLKYLAARALTKKGTSPIICLMGPPGTGKTSIVRSVARVLDKEYMRISLGGVRNEMEIRGHRKTYMDAVPDRIVEGIRQASVSNPLMLLGETGKVSSDYKGDTSPALLEILDKEQNVKFRDHYVEPPIDLSQVPSIATASTAQTIPGSLLDHIKLTKVNSYIENEKFRIAGDYLVTKQMERNDLKKGQITSSDRSLEEIIHNHIRGAGVRNPERCIGNVCRKAARQLLKDKRKSVRITENGLERYLGKEKMTFGNANEKDEISIIRGLAWTSVGGDTLQVEVSVMPGKGSLLMTGQLRDVVKEPARIALAYAQFVCLEYGIDDDYFEKHNLYTHIPEGTVPKDGSSAGTIMATVMLSAVTGKGIQAKVAMIGKMTPRGRVLSIEGLKEKILTTKVARIERVLVPDKNHPDMAELPKEIIRGLDIIYVKAMEDMVSEVFV